MSITLCYLSNPNTPYRIGDHLPAPLEYGRFFHWLSISQLRSGPFPRIDLLLFEFTFFY